MYQKLFGLVGRKKNVGKSDRTMTKHQISPVRILKEKCSFCATSSNLGCDYLRTMTRISFWGQNLEPGLCANNRSNGVTFLMPLVLILYSFSFSCSFLANNLPGAISKRGRSNKGKTPRWKFYHLLILAILKPSLPRIFNFQFSHGVIVASHRGKPRLKRHRKKNPLLEST